MYSIYTIYIQKARITWFLPPCVLWRFSCKYPGPAEFCRGRQQDLCGTQVFPSQVAILLSERQVESTGGG